MNTLTSYEGFLARAGASLLAEGAHNLMPGESRPPWLSGWDALLLAQSPGTAVVYAFTRGSMDLSRVRERIDRLAAGLTGSGMANAGRLGMVAVVTYESRLERSFARRVANLVPSAFYASLAPSTWVVDLAAGTLTAPRSLRRPEGKEALERAIADDVLLTPDQVAAQGDVIQARNRAFTDLVRGRQPVMTYGLIAVNAVLFLLLMASGGPGSTSALITFGAMVPRLVEDGQWWRLVSTMFVHGGIAHIVFNMTSLFVLGTLVERLFGSIKFLAIYLGAGLAGSIVSFAHAVQTGVIDSPYIGASGAIFGLAGALIAIRFQRSDVVPRNVRDRISTGILPLVLLNLVWAALTPYVDNYAHVGGLIGGFALSFLLPLTRGSVDVSA